MGIFGKNASKRDVSAETGTGNYVAPTVNASAPTPRTATAPAQPAAQAATAKTTSKRGSFETCDPDAMSGTAPDLEVGKTPSATQNSLGTSAVGQKSVQTAQIKNPKTPSAKKAAPAAKPEPTPAPQPELVASSFDEPSVVSGGGGTFTQLRSADSEDSKDSAFTITRNGQYLTLNGFANGHLMRWKFAAEEGPAFIRIPAVLLALGCIGTTAFPLVAYDGFWTIPLMICAVHTWILSILIVVLEARVIGIRDPTNFRARIRGVITRYVNVTRLVWGRGLLYIYAGSMNLTIDDRYVIYSAFPLMALGLIAVGTGAHASYNLDRMKSSLTDEAFLWSKFEANDHDHDNKIDVNGFAELLWSLGLEFDDVYTFKAFQQIDTHRKNKITFEQFKQWWIVTQNDGRRLRS